MIEVVPTVVPDSLADVVHMRERYAQFLTALHVDAADGQFAPNTTWMPKAGERFPDADTIHYRAHLMVTDQRSAGLMFIHAGAKAIEGHVEAFGSIDEGLSVIHAWRQAGAEQVGVVLLLQTPLEAVEPYLASCDFVRLMTIARIGTQGIPFEESSIARVTEFHAKHPDVVISIDGGVSEKNIQALSRAGASSFTAGSAIAKAADPAVAYRHLLELAEAV